MELKLTHIHGFVYARTNSVFIVLYKVILINYSNYWKKLNDFHSENVD